MPVVKDGNELLQSVVEARAKIEALEKQMKDAAKVRDEAEQELITYLENRDQLGFKSEALRMEVTKVEQPRVSIEKGMKEEALDYIDEELGRHDAVKSYRNIHHATLTSVITSEIQEGRPLPDGMFKTWWQKTLRIKKL